MAEQNLQLIAVVSQKAETTETPDIQKLLEESIRKKYKHQTQRFQTAFTYSTVATLGVIIALFVFSALNILNIRPLPETYRLFVPFREWRVDDNESPPVGSWSQEIGNQLTRLYNATADIGASIFSNDGQGNVAGIARLCTLVSVSFAVWFAFRRQLATYYEINAQKAQLEDFNATPRWQFWLSRVLFTLATLFGTYVVVSTVWFGLSLVFKNMILNWPDAFVVIILFTGAVTFAATYGALAVTTRDVLLLGLFTFAIGLSVSFALAPANWYLGAVSNAGQLNPSAPLFTGTLLGGSLALVVLWFDMNSIIEKMISDGNIRLFNARAWMWVARVLYAFLILGLVFVGFIRVDKDNYPFNMVFHAGGAISAIASVVIAGLLIRKSRFHPWYKIFSVHILLGLTIGMAVFGSLKLESPYWVYPGTGMISLTVIELSLMILIGLWVYFTVDGLLINANINAFDGQVLVMASKDKADT